MALRLTRLAVCGMMLLTLGLQVWSMQCVSFGTMRADGSHQIDGYTNIRKSQQYAAQWQTLTDENVQDMVRTYQQILAENPEFDGALADFSFLQGTLVSFLWPEVEDQTQTYPTLTIYYVDPARLTGLYERREEKTRILPGKPVFKTRRTGSSFWTWTTGWTSPWHTAGLLGGLSFWATVSGVLARWFYLWFWPWL